MEMNSEKHSARFSEFTTRLLISILATVISIVLTFGTARWWENRKQDKTRRMMAMMVIHDIDESIEKIRDMIEWDEEGRALTMRLLANIDSLERFPADTLSEFINYLIPGVYNPGWEFDKSNEAIFNSSQESWNTLNDMTFIRNVQKCYHYRSILEQEREEWIYFQKPVSKEESYEMIMNVEALQDEAFFIPLCKRLLTDSKVRHYVDNSFWRCYLYNNILSACMELNESNRFLMNISDEQLKEFEKKTVEQRHKASKKEIIGSWSFSSGEDYSAEITFRKDRTLTNRHEFRYSSPVYSGKIKVIATMNGTWEMTRDSLIRNYDLSSLEVTVDDSGISYRPENEEIVQKSLDSMHSGALKEEIKASLANDNRNAGTVYLSANGKKMELSDGEELPTLYTRVTKTD